MTDPIETLLAMRDRIDEQIAAAEKLKEKRDRIEMDLLLVDALSALELAKKSRLSDSDRMQAAAIRKRIAERVARAG